MNIEFVRNFCISKKGVTESLPFNEDSPVYKVKGKIFLIANLNPPISINVKCDPELAVDLRERFDCVKPGYHMNKLHWNTIDLDNSVSDKLVFQWIDHSYNLVVKRLKKSLRKELEIIEFLQNNSCLKFRNFINMDTSITQKVMLS